jgi:hypothetical protein
MNPSIYQVGFWSGLMAFCATFAYCFVQILQMIGAVGYPLDEILIYGTSLCIVIPFLLAILALHHITPVEKKFWSHGALIFSIIYAVFVTANYVVQLATVIPLKIKGASDDIGLLEQTPHSMFWNFDAIGYIFMGLATLIAIPIFKKETSQRWVRIFFIANALVTPLIAIVYFYPEFSENLLFIGFPWAITAPGAMLTLALMFRQKAVLNNIPGKKEHTAPLQAYF